MAYPGLAAAALGPPGASLQVEVERRGVAALLSLRLCCSLLPSRPPCPAFTRPQAAPRLTSPLLSLPFPSISLFAPSLLYSWSGLFLPRLSFLK